MDLTDRKQYIESVQAARSSVRPHRGLNPGNVVETVTG
jgi:hypothetical protein